MIEYSDFEEIVVNELGRDIRSAVNPDQYKAINAVKDDSLLIVAGPGSGKTTVMVLKVLKFIFVDNIEPSDILVTTFTRKAASQLKDRITEWGNKLKSNFINNPKYADLIDNLNNIIFKKMTIGTIDSISEDVLRNSMDSRDLPFTIIEDFVSNSLMTKIGILDHGRQKDRQLKSFLNQIRGTKSRLNVSIMSQILLEIKDRIYHDRIDLDKFIGNYEHPGAEIAHDTILDYTNELKKRSLLDFSMLEDEFLKKLQNGKLKNFLKHIKIILIDEYQDTNQLQETIYFEIARAAIKNKGCIIVVGDDDQSLYRFRGATVELFRNFAQRIENELSIKPGFINLSRNYRSTENIVDFCNEFIQIDKGYEKARVEGKMPIVSSREDFFPVLGMFRKDLDTLSKDIASFLNEIVHGDGFNFQYGNRTFNICIDEKNGSPGDIALLCGSPLELDFKGNERLPCLLKDELSKLNPQIPIFNPRGQNFARIKVVEILCGILLECIDPEGFIQNDLRGLPQNAVFRFNAWRSRALNYIENEDNDYKFIKEFIDTWKMVFKLTGDDVQILDLINSLIKWIPEMQEGEGIVYLEVITKTITQTSLFSDFEAKIVLDDKAVEHRYSIIEAIWNIFVPIAIGAINIDLDVLEDLPKNQINVMSIHQSKGLEFPIVIVDVGSDFKMNYSYHSFRRFPGTSGKSCTIEDNMREYSPIGKPKRDGKDRAFDDIIRQYFTAFSRSKNILMLVGLNSVKDGYFFNGQMRYVPNMATGWDRKEKWHWNGLQCLFHI